MTIKGFWAVGSRVADPLAEAAFFEALGKAQGTAAPAAPVASAAPIQTAQVMRAAPAAAPSEQPQKILRPGSLLDIRV